MRSKFLMLLTLAFWQLLGAAQTPEQGSPVMNAQAERERIAQGRADQETLFLKVEGECYSHFAVSDCLRTARKDRRIAMDELRRQELVLNDMERKTKALEALKRIETNLAAQQQKQQASPDRSTQTPN